MQKSNSAFGLAAALFQVDWASSMLVRHLAIAWLASSFERSTVPMGGTA